jgi:hypothetical protein
MPARRHHVSGKQFNRALQLAQGQIPKRKLTDEIIGTGFRDLARQNIRHS